MRTLVSLDHSFHVKTRSTQFLAAAWEAAGWKVVYLWDDGWQGGKEVTPEEVASHRPDVLLSFQILKPAEFYHATGCRHVLLVPMYDSSRGMKPWDWWEYRNFSFLHFSSTLQGRLARLGIPGTYLQYFPNPAEFQPLAWEARSGDAFFWERVKSLPVAKVLPILRLILGPGGHGLHLHRAADPGEILAPIDPRGFHVSETHWFQDRDALTQHVAHCRIFVAPRLAEGIGMSFLEAMALGCVVVAQKDSTMDEYIRDGKNGLLVDWTATNPTTISKPDLQAIAASARSTVEAGYPTFRESLQQTILKWEKLFEGGRWFTATGGLAALLYFMRHRVLRPVKVILARWNRV